MRIRSIHAEADVQRWVAAGVISEETAVRIRLFESNRARGRSWLVPLSLSCGALTFGAGLLLFVAAHWDTLSPGGRFALVLAMVGLLHGLGAAFAERSRPVSEALHAVGTVATGAAIFLTAQIFNLQEHWPSGVLLWAAAAWVGWLVLRHWPQAALAALLTPAWLLSEWEEMARHRWGADFRIPASFLVLLSIAYFAGEASRHDGATRKALRWIGGIALLPSYVCLAVASPPSPPPPASAWEPLWWNEPMPRSLAVLGWIIALLLPALVSLLLRRRRAWPFALCLVWTVVMGQWSFSTPAHRSAASAGLHLLHGLAPFVWSALGAAGLAAWGLREHARERINMGMAVFMLAVLLFYSSDLMDRLGRSASLIGLGLLMLLAGYVLETTRKRLVQRLEEEIA